MEHDATLPASLDRFGTELVARLQRLQRRNRRRRLAAVGIAVTALLAGTALAATHALDESRNSHPVYRIGHDSAFFDSAQLLYGRFARELLIDQRVGPLEITLPPSARRLAGTPVLIRHVASSYCLQAVGVPPVQQYMCGEPSSRRPILGIGISQSNAPFVYTGLEASNVVRHIIRCGRDIQNVTSNAGSHRFLYISPRPLRGARCTQTSTLRDGSKITAVLRR
jgi:hypothetical protein